MPPSTMTAPVVVKNELRIGLVALLQTFGPALVAVGLLYYTVFAFGAHFRDYFHLMAIFVALLMLLMPVPTRTPRGELLSDSLPLVFSVLIRWAVVLGALLAIAYVTKFTENYSRRVVITWATATPGVLVVLTVVLDDLMRRLLCAPQNSRRAVFAGYNDSSRSLAQQLRTRAEYCMSVVGFFDDRGADRLRPDRDDRLLGRLSELAEWVQKNYVEVIFVALPVGHIQRVSELLNGLRDTTASIYYVPDMVVYDLIQARSGLINGIPVIAMCETPIYGLRGVAKRLTDIIVTSLALLALLPVMIVIAVLIKASSPGPVIFAQRRYGLNGGDIVVYKFRTMSVTEDGAHITQASRGDPRITPIGRILRKYSLDELPQLINVLQGRMSLVGPRPHAVAHNEMYRKLIDGYMMRHKVLPGITGLAQVNGLRGETRNLEDMEARVQFDIEYLRRWSVGLDLRILAQTAIRVWNDRNAF